jgi:hypothetical protein
MGIEVRQSQRVYDRLFELFDDVVEATNIYSRHYFISSGVSQAHICIDFRVFARCAESELG